MSHVQEETFWSKELAAFKKYLTEEPNGTYQDWQPTKWQALQRICDNLVNKYGEDCTALELGCGSATLLLQLAMAGWYCTGIDFASSAIDLALLAARGLPVCHGHIQFINDNFNNWNGPTADVVLSIGVIEHIDQKQQRSLLDMHDRLAQKAVLIGVPNLNSPVYSSFIVWAQRNDRLYEDKHFPTTIRNLANDMGLRVLIEDGCHIFLSKSDYFIAGDPELDTFYESLRTRLMRVGGERFLSFPCMNLTSADINHLYQIEAETSSADRLRFGFLHYYVLEASA